MLDLDHSELLAIALDVDRVEDRQQAADIALAVGDDDRVRSVVGDEGRVLRDQWLDRLCDGFGVDESERNEPSDEAVTIGRRAIVLDRVDARFLDVSNRDDLVGVARTEDE